VFGDWEYLDSLYLNALSFDAGTVIPDNLAGMSSLEVRNSMCSGETNVVIFISDSFY
jgi:hypothetical protein